MNLSAEVVKWPARYKPIPPPYYVVRCDEHFMVCTLTNDFDLIDEVSVIHCSAYVARKWAFFFAKDAADSYKYIKTLELIMGMAGNPDASEGCRNIIKVAREAMAELGES